MVRSTGSFPTPVRVVLSSPVLSAVRSSLREKNQWLPRRVFHAAALRWISLACPDMMSPLPDLYYFLAPTADLPSNEVCSSGCSPLPDEDIGVLIT